MTYLRLSLMLELTQLSTQLLMFMAVLMVGLKLQGALSNTNLCQRLPGDADHAFPVNGVVLKNEMGC